MNHTPPSNAEDLFHHLLAPSDPFGRITALVTSNPPSSETEWLDLKGAERIRDDDIQKDWSKALAGFANTSGGVLVWGIDAREVDGVDAASGLSLVNDPLAFKSRLNELLIGATEPPVHNVLIEPVPDPADASRGFVVCLIPESRFKPHRAERASKQWYIRAADRFDIIPVSFLRTLFHPSTSAQLKVWVKCEIQRGSDRNLQLVSVDIENTGPVSVYDICVRCFPPPGIEDCDSTQWRTTYRQTASGPSYVSKTPIHPGERLGLLQLPNPETNTCMKFWLTAKDQHPFISKVECSPLDFEQAIWRETTPVAA